ncbi:hypothetical protein T484DRAFT_1802992, partial [Baffinella frigidus]
DIVAARNATGGKAADRWPTDPLDVRLVLERFDPLQIEWELSTLGGRSDDEAIVMQPGYEYILEATIEVRPIYAADVMEVVTIQRWERQVVSTTASRAVISDPDRAHKVVVRYYLQFDPLVVVRYHLQFDPLVRAQIFRTVYTAKALLDAFGAATGYIVLGVIFLNLIRRVKTRGQLGTDPSVPGASSLPEFRG